MFCSDIISMYSSYLTTLRRSHTFSNTMPLGDSTNTLSKYGYSNTLPLDDSTDTLSKYDPANASSLDAVPSLFSTPPSADYGTAYTTTLVGNNSR